MYDELKQEVDGNHDFFQRNVAEFLRERAGQYALLKSREVIGFYDGPAEAYRTGLKMFSDEIFSIQEVTDEPVELGLMSLAVI